jgi:uncharacterized protein
MAPNSSAFHESENTLPSATRDMHRALVSLMEELEAIDWYQQRVEASADSELRDILAHNRDEEIEHAVMVLEWVRRRNAVFDAQLRRYLFRKGSITAIEDAGTSNGHETAGLEPAADRAAVMATLGSLRNAR